MVDNLRIEIETISPLDMHSLKGVLAEACRLHSSGNINEAKITYLSLLEKGFRNPVVINNLALIYISSNNHRKAIAFFEFLIKRYPLYADSYINLAHLLFERSMFFAAINILYISRQINKNNHLFYWELANVNKSMRKLDCALNAIRIAISLYRKDPNYYVLMSEVLFDQKRYKESEDIILNNINQFPDDSLLQHRLTRHYMLCCNLFQAKLSAIKVIYINPIVLESYLTLSKIILSMSNCNEAIIIARKFESEFSLLAGPKINLAMLLLECGKLKQAEKYIRHAIKIDSSIQESYSVLGIILRKKGDVNGSKEITTFSLGKNPYCIKSLLNMGILLQNEGKYDQAISFINKVLEINSSNSDAWINLGSIYQDMEKYSEAYNFTKKALNLDQNNIQALSNLALIFNQKGDFVNEKRILYRILKLDSKQYKVLYDFSRHYSSEDLFYREMLFSVSMDELSNSEKIDILFAKSNILDKEKDYNQASKYLNQANKLKLTHFKSNYSQIKSKADKMIDIINANEKISNLHCEKQFIFIVGMPRSGSTLVESILCLNPSAVSLGEVNYIDEFFKDINPDKHSEISNDLKSFYLERVYARFSNPRIIINKYLYDYIYISQILNSFPNTKIIYCNRNPLDNILSLYKAHFPRGNEYSSSLTDCAKLVLHTEYIMSRYKSSYCDLIYTINYEKLVQNTDQEIPSLINWLGWKWDIKYMSPHLSKRLVGTISSIQVRNPINRASVGQWRQYYDLLKPAINILIQNSNYKNLLS